MRISTFSGRDGLAFSRQAALSATTALAIALTSFPAAAQTTGQEQTVRSSAGSGQLRSFSIPRQPLAVALSLFSRQSGLQVSQAEGVAENVTANAVSGSYTPEQALDRLLDGTGISYRMGANRSVLIGPVSAPASAGDGMLDEGATVLPTIVISGKTGRVAAIEAPYETAAPTAHISEENIERFRGSSPADIFRGTPGVLSGEARNGAGAIDVNIRGMQGMGRVATTVDGAENSMQVYQGYQGISNRTFVDPDLLAGVDITKGSDVASGAIAGTVAMRTLDAADIVEDGRTFGLKMKGGFGSNTSSPQAGNAAGYSFANIVGGVGTATASEDGMDRPAFLKPTQGSGSVVAAMQSETVDLLAGYAYRKRGNYHAGSHGSYAEPVWTGGRGTTSGLYRNYIINGGLLNYRAGEEVLNTELETKSWIAKGTVRFGDAHSLQLGYTGYRSEAGDLLARRLTSNTSQAVQEEQTTGTDVDTGTLKYRWNPDGNDLIDLKANLWISRLKSVNPPRWDTVSAESLGLPSDYRVGTTTTMWGASLDNTSSFETRLGSFDLTYGLSYRNEDTSPLAYSEQIENVTFRNAARDEAAAYAKAAYKPWDWLTLNGGLRYSYFQTDDRNVSYTDAGQAYYASPSDGGFSPSVGVTVEPWEGTQFYVNYSNAMRMPSLFESSSSFISVNEAVVPERSSNWEVGANFIRDGIFTGDDRGMLKLGFFDWRVNDYISREWYTYSGVSSLRMHNIDSAHFQGLELSARYERGGFTAELAANYYTDVEFCRTADSCGNKSLYADYATNQVPPEYSVDLTLSHRFYEDKLTVGGRVSYVGERAIGHGDVTAQGVSEFIALVDWDAYTLVDVFAEYKINENFTASLRAENLFDRFYVDPLSIVAMPGPGRTFYASLTAKF